MLFAQSFMREDNVCWFLLLGSGAVIAVLFKLLIASKDEIAKALISEKDRVIVELVTEKLRNKEIAAEALAIAVEEVNWHRQAEGKPPIDTSQAGVPERRLPGTAAEKEKAEGKSMQALVEIIKRETGRDPKNGGLPAVDPFSPPK